jgi:hypothetical protein
MCCASFMTDADADATINLTVGAAIGWPIRLDREAEFCARLERRGTCHTALIILGLVLAWISVIVCAYHYTVSDLFFLIAQLDIYIYIQLPALPRVLTTGERRGGLGGLHRCSSSRLDQSSHHRCSFTLGSSLRKRIPTSLKALRISR